MTDPEELPLTLRIASMTDAELLRALVDLEAEIAQRELPDGPVPDKDRLDKCRREAKAMRDALRERGGI